MPITLHTVTNFNTLRERAIRLAESLHPRPINIGDDTITYGWGFTFLRKSTRNGVDTWLRYEHLNSCLAAIGITLSENELEDLDRIGEALTANHLNGPTGARQRITDFIARWNQPAQGRDRPNLTDDRARLLFNADMDFQSVYLSDRLRGLLGATEGQRVYDSLLGTREMVAVFTNFYNGQKLFGQGIANALSEGNRAEAWFQLRYGWKESIDPNPRTNPNNGWAKRHYMESTVFGLYNDPANISLDDAKDAFRMLQLHRGRIRQYEKLYDTQVGLGNNDYRTLLSDPQIAMTIPALSAAMDPAKYVLLAQLRQENSSLADLDITAFESTNIYFDPGRDLDTKNERAIGTVSDTHTALLSAVKYDSANAEYASKDILIGEGGNDYLVGGKGDDILLGGEGRDLYYYRMGDGNDRVIDADGGLLVIHADTYDLYVSGNFTKKADADEWTQAVTGSDRAVHTVTLSHGATWQMRLDDGAIIDLGQGDDLKRFGIQLNLGTLPDPGSPTLVGDPQIHFKAAVVQGSEPANWVVVRRSNEQPIKNESGEQTGVKYDAEYFLKDPATGNPTEPGGPAYDDTLAGTSNADFIRGLLGNDSIAGNAGGDRLEGGEGDDQLHGNDQDDTLLGGAGSDMLHGDAGKDRLFAQAAVSLDEPGIRGDYDTAVPGRGDLLSGGADDDILIGAAADDMLAGGMGIDLMYGGAGDDLLSGDVLVGTVNSSWNLTRTPDMATNTYRWVLNQGSVSQSDSVGGDDMLYGGGGVDWVFGGAGNDLVDGGTGEDVLFGDAGNDVVLGGAGKDVMNGDDGDLAVPLQGNDWLDGGDGDDSIWGMAGADVLIGGKGNDTMYGGAGRDTYIYNKGDGVDYVVDDDKGSEKSIVILGAGVSKDDFKLRKGSLLLDFSNGDALHIENFNADDPLSNASIEAFQFADGSSLSWGDLLARGFDLDGTEGDDTIVGTGIEDRIDGKAGNDLIWGSNGNDVLTGGTGTDGLNGGLGDDVYVFSAGDAATMDGTATGVAETLAEEGGQDTIRFTAGVDPQQLVLLDNLDGSLVIDYSAQAQPLDRLLIHGGLAGDIERFEVGAGDDPEGVQSQARNFSYTQFVGEFGDGIYRGTDADGHEHASGGRGSDDVGVSGGGNQVSGGKGNDTVRAFGLNNTIHYSAGDGTDTVWTNVSGNPGNVLRLGGIDASQLRLGLDASRHLVVTMGDNADDRMVFQRFDATNVAAIKAFDHIEFDDGSTLSYDQLMAKGLDIFGGDAAEIIEGTNVDDRISGLGGDDRIDGLAGNDVLAGEGGDDILSGGVGDDSYRFAAGSGKDTVIDAAGFNAVEFGAGLTLAMMAASQGIGIDGRRYLDLDFGNGDRLSIQNGELNRVQSFRFGDGTMLATSDLLAAMPAVTLVGESSSESLRGYAGNDMLLGQAGDDVLEGGAGSDLLDGGSGNDTVRGGDGTDWLNGGGGIDQLLGGSGVDTYVFGAGSGQVAIVESTGEQSVLTLAAGASALSLRPVREGGDLLLSMDNGGDVLRIAGYYDDAESGSNWQVQSADGTISTMTEFIAVAGQTPQTVAAAYEKYRDSVRGDVSAHLLNQGYQSQADGSWSSNSTSVAQSGPDTHITSVKTSMPGIVFEAETQADLQTAWAAPRWESTGEQTVTVLGSAQRFVNSDRLEYSGPSTPYFVPAGSINHYYVPVKYMRLANEWERKINEATSHDPGANHDWWLDYRRALQLNWEPPPGATAEQMFDGNGAFLGVWVYPPSAPVPTTETMTLTSNVSTTTVTIPELTLGAGNDEVGLYAHGMVDGGMGDDSLHAAFFVDGGHSYPSWGMSGGGLLYGNDGNDYLSGASGFGLQDGDNILIGGRGRDVLTGGGGADTFMLLEEDSVDYITDTGSALGYRIDWRNEGELIFANPELFSIAGNEHAALEAYYGSYIRPDSVIFGAGTSASSVSVFMSDSPQENQGPWYEPVLQIMTAEGTGAQITLARADDAAGTGIEYVQFGDGTRQSIGQVLARRDQSQNVLGTLGRDVIRTGAGDDRIDGGASGDLLAGGAGNDTYVIRRNTGFDTIDQGNALPGDADVIEFAADVAPADVALSMDETGLNLRIAGSGSGAKLLGWTGNDSNLSVRFSDGTVWDAATLQSLLATVRGSTGADSLIGTGGNDILLGYEGGDSLNAGGGDDLLDGGPGNDILMGGAGDDTYLFGRSSGSDFILASGSLVSDRDVVRLDPDIAPADVFLSRQSFGVLLALDGSAATLSIGNGLSTPSIQFADGTVWGAAVLNAAPILGTALAETLAGGNVGETILGVGGNDFLFGHGGDDVLDGGAGDDLLDGGSGNDVYLFGRGSGHDHIQQYSASIGDLDRIRFGAGIAASDVTAVRDSFGLHFTLVDSGETLDAGLPNGAMFASVEFADGTVWDSTSLAALPITLQGSAVIDNLVGTSGNDRILGLAGDDRLYGEAGDDLLLGGDGDDLLFGGDGNDELQGGRGADLLYGGPGATKLRFDRGDGADQVFPGALDATIGYTLSFGAGVTSSEIRVTKDSSFVTVSIEGSGDSVSFYQGNGVLLPAVEFESGAYWSPQYVDYLLHTVGTAGSDELVGGGDADVLQGFAGNDELQGQGGADTLVGGAGSDRLDGGAGNDVYLYSRGDGSDTLVLSGNGEDEVDTLRFAADIAPGDVAVFAAEEGGESLVIDLGSAGGDGGEGEAPRDRITLQDWFEVGSRGLRVEFGDGTVWDAATLTEMGTPPVREIIGTAGNDEIDGSEAREVIHGLAGNDELYGGGGDDTLTGGTGNDYISGGSGHDVIDFARGDGWDELGLYESPDDSDIIRMGEGIRQEDVVVGRRGDDLLLLLADGDEGISVRWWFEYPTGLASVEFQDGSHWDAASLAEMADESELIFGSAWGDELFGTRYDDHIIGLGGNDVLEGYAGNDILIGGTGNDVAFGGGGADFLVGGSGVDSLWGGEGADTYLYRLGDGWDEINSWALSGEDESPVGGDIIRFGLGILPGGVSVAARQFDGEVVIELEAGGGDGGEGGGGGLRVFGDLDYLPSVSFADGTVISPEQLLDLAAAWVGSEDSDVLIGTAADDHILAGAGEDVLYGRDGDDVLAGGADFDRLRGGRGDDVYLFGLGDGEDIIDTRDGGADVIRFGAGISVGDLIFGDYNEGEGYRIGNLETDDTIVVLADAASLPAVEFADGTTWTRDELLAKFWSHAPMLEDEVEAQSAVAGETFELAVDADLFWDPDQWAGDTLSYRAMQADGSPLPGWLGFDAESLSFSGVPGSGDGGELDVRLVATDRAGNSVAAGFTLSVDGGNTAPVVLAPPANQNATENLPFLWSLPSNTFADADVGDELTYTVTLANGDSLPAWLDFDASANRLVGTPDSGTQGSIALTVRATDRGGLTAEASFTVSIGPHLRGSGSSDTLDYSASSFTGVAMIDGGTGNDAIIGSFGADVIVGGTGSDNLNGGAGDDVFLLSGTDAGYDRFEGGAGFDVLQGSAGDDTFRMYQFTGAATVERIEGNGGNDVVAGTGSSDTLDFSATELVGIAQIDGGSGNDAITGSFGADIIVGGTGSDNLNGGAGDDVFLLSGTDAGYDRFEGGAGFDILQGSSGDDTFRIYQFTGAATVERIEGNGGNDVVAGTGSSDTLDFSATELVGIAQIDGGSGNDAITGSFGADIIVGGTGSDNLNGGAGDDVFLLSGTDAGYDRFEGGAGFDILQGSSGDDTFRMYQFTGAATVERIEGNGGNDVVAGTGSSDTLDFSATELVGISQIDGGAGNDAITGSAGADVIVGGTGSDNLNGGAGDDAFLLAGTDAGYDRFEGGAGFDVLQGSAGDDTFRMYQYTGAATVERIQGNGGNDIVAGTGSSDTLDFSATELVGIAQIDGGSGNDAITGSAGADVIVGGTGSDNLNGGAGDDVFLLSGTDAGYDRFEGGAGFDILQGSSGDDTFRMYQFTGAATVERIEGNGGNDVVAGTGSSDTLDFSATELVGISQIDGGAGNDAITGSAGADVIVGGTGSDNLNGGAGDDVFLLAGTDAGYDRFEGGAGYDLLQGSAGDDTFRMYQFTGAATVERIDGNGGNDVVAGTGSSDTLDFSATELVGIAQIDGGSGNDAITGSAGDDIIVGGTGSDRLKGGLGSDSYRFGRGDGVDTLVESDATPANMDAAEFLAGIGTDQIWMRHVGNNLEASIIGTADKLIVENWYLGSEYRVEQFTTADGRVLLDSQVENLVQAMAAFAPPAAGQTVLPQAYQDALAPTIAVNWQ